MVVGDIVSDGNGNLYIETSSSSSSSSEITNLNSNKITPGHINLNQSSNHVLLSGGSSGQVLTTTGTGTTAWRDVSMDIHEARDITDLRINVKSKYIPMERLSYKSFDNHISISFSENYSIGFYNNIFEKFMSNIFEYLENDVKEYYSYCESKILGMRKFDLYFESKDDFDMLNQHIVQWKLELSDVSDVNK